MKSLNKTQAASAAQESHRATHGGRLNPMPAASAAPPAFAPLHRFINCLMAEASGRTE